MVPKYTSIARKKLCVSQLCEYNLVFAKTDKNDIIIKLLAETRDTDHVLAGCLTFGIDTFIGILQGIDKISDKIRAQFQEPEIAAQVRSGRLKIKPTINNWLAGTDSIVEFACKLNGSNGGVGQQLPDCVAEQLASTAVDKIAGAALRK